MHSLQELLDLMGPELVPLVVVLGVYLLRRFFFSSSLPRTPSPAPFPDVFSEEVESFPEKEPQEHQNPHEYDEGSEKPSPPVPSSPASETDSPVRPQSPKATAAAHPDPNQDAASGTKTRAEAASPLSGEDAEEPLFAELKDKESLRKAWLYGQIFERRV